MKISFALLRRVFATLLAATAFQAPVIAAPISTTPMTTNPDIHYLQRAEGRAAWTLHGNQGPLLIGMPGMGDLRVNWNGFAEALVVKGYRIAVLDLRGQGQSDATFADVTREAMAQDALALADRLSPETPVILIGHSYTGASAVWAATERPERVKAAILLSPFARAVPITLFQKLALKVGLMRPWGASAWASYYKSLFPVHQPKDLPARVEAVRANMKEPGRLKSLRAMGNTTVTACEARLDKIRRPTFIVFGSRDPDFPDPAAEGKLLAHRTGGKAILIPDAGHYPHEEDPFGIADSVAAFLASLSDTVTVGTEPMKAVPTSLQLTETKP